MTLEDVNTLVDLFKQNPVAGLIALLPWLAIAWRWVRSNAPPPTPGTTWAKICTVLDMIAGVIPTAKVDAKPALPPPVATIPTGVIREFPSGVPLEPDRQTQATLVSSRRDDRREDRTRRRVRRLAKVNGIDVSEMSDSDIDDALEQARAKAEQVHAGPIRDFFTWIFENPEILLSILKLFVFMKANGAHEVTA